MTNAIVLFAHGARDARWAEPFVAIAGRVRAARPGLAIAVVLLGAWGNDAQAAADRLLAAFGVLADSGIGRLLGVRSPVAPARVRASPEALTLACSLSTSSNSSSASRRASAVMRCSSRGFGAGVDTARKSSR